VVSFESAAAEFLRFAVSEGYPRELLWVKTEDVLLGRWLGQFRYFVWQGDPIKRQGIAQIEYENALKREMGMIFEAKCRTDRWTICHLYVPLDDEDAQHRLVPKVGVKQKAAVEPLSTVLVRNRMWWLFLKWTLTTKQPAWD